jgi:hypothetical protein
MIIAKEIIGLLPFSVRKEWTEGNEPEAICSLKITIVTKLGHKEMYLIEVDSDIVKSILENKTVNKEFLFSWENKTQEWVRYPDLEDLGLSQVSEKDWKWFEFNLFAFSDVLIGVCKIKKERESLFKIILRIFG